MTTSLTGTVKWFNEAKGYGFIAPDNGSKDLFAHFREIQSTDGYRTLAENARVQFDVTEGAKGPQAANIRPIA
ncbi:cold-shock protein [Ramlibacter rhizophilus]|uniref:Cold shock-like protein CspA n=1 Tax=Ramlibacter rhizophilus TaxID=1781167 RepID=A0A4Z0BPC2_9BURK|nr:cold shock domain-containing protein [Ramlibacter rhizophilus]TFY99808.1 cold shock domain-containing protein [Ramlibacter rhizophilus]